MPTESETLPLIRTKLYRPSITADRVPRPQVSAPAVFQGFAILVGYVCQIGSEAKIS